MPSLPELQPLIGVGKVARTPTVGQASDDRVRYGPDMQRIFRVQPEAFPAEPSAATPMCREFGIGGSGTCPAHLIFLTIASRWICSKRSRVIVQLSRARGIAIMGQYNLRRRLPATDCLQAVAQEGGPDSRCTSD